MSKPDGIFRSMAAYPKGVFFMLGNEVCERFTYHGLRAILTLYLISELSFAER